MIIKYGDARRGQVVLDVNADEVEDLARKRTKTRAKAGDGRAGVRVARSFPPVE